ncbi:hypothetical protein [Arthrobacter sp. Bz4]|uniref:hypothetical protein n=1 Tax=Arthrobacter sp. Bz4 TaxID=2171979 RepID=UPI000D5159A8|nr:hypothetical protein [Arthrobacter sp. Bz4]PVE19182.1 hypothetical protein DDA93_05050 [Arthrobacter sp. Bz4]
MADRLGPSAGVVRRAVVRLVAVGYLPRVLGSAADGSWTGAMINMVLMEEELQRDLAAHRGLDQTNSTSKVTAS